MIRLPGQAFPERPLWMSSLSPASVFPGSEFSPQELQGAHGLCFGTPFT